MAPTEGAYKARSEPKTKEELVEGIQAFWKTVDAALCAR